MAVSELENALRNALAKGDASNPAFRQRVYRAAADALQRTLKAQPDIDPDRAANQKQRLADAIRATEAVYTPPAAEPAPAASPDVRAESRFEQPEAQPKAERSAPETAVTGLRADPRFDAGEENAAPSAALDDGTVGPVGEQRQRQRRRAPFAWLLSAAVAVGLIGIGIWWIVTTGALQTAEQRDTSVPNPPLELQNESFQGSRDPGTATAPARVPSDTSRNDGWVTLFQPADPTTISLNGNATATIESDAIGQFARIVSPSAQSAITIDIPPGTLESLAGKTAQFSIVARSDDNAPTQMSVTCDLAGFGDCGRLRFNVTQNDNEFLFRVDFPADASAGGPGSLVIVTDIDNGGRAVKLIGVRVRELES